MNMLWTLLGFAVTLVIYYALLKAKVLKIENK